LDISKGEVRVTVSVVLFLLVAGLYGVEETAAVVWLAGVKAVSCVQEGWALPVPGAVVIHATRDAMHFLFLVACLELVWRISFHAVAFRLLGIVLLAQPTVSRRCVVPRVLTERK
jgi:hypothetical protein